MIGPLIMKAQIESDRCFQVGPVEIFNYDWPSNYEGAN